jgi:hypothetical protein
VPSGWVDRLSVRDLYNLSLQFALLGACFLPQMYWSDANYSANQLRSPREKLRVPHGPDKGAVVISIRSRFTGATPGLNKIKGHKRGCMLTDKRKKSFCTLTLGA